MRDVHDEDHDTENDSEERTDDEEWGENILDRVNETSFYAYRDGNYMFALPLQPTPGAQSQLDVLKNFLFDPTPCQGPNCSRPNSPVIHQQAIN